MLFSFTSCLASRNRGYMMKNHRYFNPDKGFFTLLSSVAAVAAIWTVPFEAQAQTSPTSPLMVQPIPSSPQPNDALSLALAEWRTLGQSESLPFSAYARFMIDHPGWPGEVVFRRNAERNIRARVEDPRLVITFFGRFPPQTATAHLRHAEALEQSGKRSEALSAARSAWITGALVPADEQIVLSRFALSLQTGDHDTRMNMLLWARSTQSAARQISLVSPQKRDLFSARLGFQMRATDAQLRADLVSAEQRNDPGFVADRINFMRANGDSSSAIDMLRKPQSLSEPPSNANSWLEMMEAVQRSASAQANYAAVYDISRQLERLYSPSTIVRDRPFLERDSYTDIAWMGGMAALMRLQKPLDAVRMFELYANAARSPQTRAKGLYWAGRAADQARRADLATLHYTAAAEFYDQFHGQLAHERLGKPVKLPVELTSVEVSGEERARFNNHDVVRALVRLGEQGNWQDQTRFVRTLGASAKGSANLVLTEELARRVNRPDLGLLVGKNARESGVAGYFTPSFPMVAVPAEHRSNWTMIHAITRQESQFDREALSRAGARGLMQLMPGTARDTAPSAGVVYNLSGLTQNPQDNIRLGSTYFGQLMSRYNGSYLLSVAAYNAGPGNVNKWIRANGDPRSPGTDVVAWVEAIPFTETRGYVQRVLENAIVYDLMNPNRGNRAPTRISVLLGGYPSSRAMGAP
jgi:soluble lytic murein transglycosylase